MKTDILIIGEGLAGMCAAIEASKSGQEVTILTKGKSGKSGNSSLARAGFSVAGDGEDQPEVQLKDTIRAGKYLNDKKLVKVFLDEISEVLDDLENYGVKFDKSSGTFRRYMSAGHSYPRMAFTVNKDGSDITLPLDSHIRKLENVRVVDNTSVLDLIKRKDHFVSVCYRKDKGLVYIISKSVILASGGMGQLYKITRNTEEATGDGFALAFNLGAELVDMEFIQHYPLEVRWPREAHLHADIAASVPALGAVLRNRFDETFMKKYDKRGDLATRDAKARAMFQEITKGNDVKGGLWLDMSMVEEKDLKETVPDYFDYFKDLGIPKSDWRVIVAPGAHFCMGGVKIDENAESTIKGMFACGEVAGGVHGANRLACNSLPDCAVFGNIAGRNAAEYAKKIGDLDPHFDLGSYTRLIEERKSNESNLMAIKTELRETMWEEAGLIRDKGGLKWAMKFIDTYLNHFDLFRIKSDLEVPELFDLRNMLVTAKIIVSSALQREESRGSHYRTDFPEQDSEDWLGNLIVRKSDNGLETRLQKILNPFFYA